MAETQETFTNWPCATLLTKEITLILLPLSLVHNCEARAEASELGMRRSNLNVKKFLLRMLSSLASALSSYVSNSVLSVIVSEHNPFVIFHELLFTKANAAVKTCSQDHELVVMLFSLDKRGIVALKQQHQLRF